MLEIQLFVLAIFTAEFLYNETSHISWLHGKQKCEFMVLNGNGVGNHAGIQGVWDSFIKHHHPISCSKTQTSVMVHTGS